MLQTFLPLLAMTFFIVLFIVLMQFLWKYIDDMVGKGLALSVMFELFFYAAVSMVPMALPLAVLLASLMTFGNLGEKFELTAMKAAGISLFRVMKPLIILMCVIAVGAFFYQNDVLPKAQVKMWTLLFSMKQKSPELEIPEGVFYDQIPGFNRYVGDKDQETGMLRDVMIYDVSNGAENASIIVADSAKLAMVGKMSHLYLHLFEGEQFENLRDQNMSSRNVPFRRETFLDKEVMISFDANFNRLDEEGMRRQYVGKNMKELNQTIDSVSQRVDSIGGVYAERMISSEPVLSLPESTLKAERNAKPLDVDSLLGQMNPRMANSVLTEALRTAEMKQRDMEFETLVVQDEKKTIRRHEIELMKKFTLSVACLIFFFIGAPLGAIIRKGGLGTPLVISVFLFLFYYIVDNTGYKMARDGRWPVEVGIWLSTFVLAPLGAYVTVKAMNDSAVFDADRYRNFFIRLLGLRQKRGSYFKEVIINDINVGEAVGRLDHIISEAKTAEKWKWPQSYMAYWLHGYDRTYIAEMSDSLEKTIDYLADCRDKKVTALLSDLPVISNVWMLRPVTARWLGWTMIILFPIGLTGYIIGTSYQKRFLKEMVRTEVVATAIKERLLPEPLTEECASPAEDSREATEEHAETETEKGTEKGDSDNEP